MVHRIVPGMDRNVQGGNCSLLVKCHRDVHHPGRGADGPGHWGARPCRGYCLGLRCFADVVNVVERAVGGEPKRERGDSANWPSLDWASSRKVRVQL